MKIYKQTKEANRKLLLLFSGWSASPEAFRHLETEPDTDLWICYDYRDALFPMEELSAYQQICLVAWSLGVWVASARDEPPLYRSYRHQWDPLPDP